MSRIIYFSLRIQSTDSGLRKMSFSSLCILRWDFFSTYPLYFLLIISKHRSYLVFRKRFYSLRKILFSFYEQSVQKNFKTSRYFAMAQHNFLERHCKNSKRFLSRKRNSRPKFRIIISKVRVRFEYTN